MGDKKHQHNIVPCAMENACNAASELSESELRCSFVFIFATNTSGKRHITMQNLNKDKEL